MNRIKLFICSLVLFSAIAVHAQSTFTVTGRVVDSTGQALIAATTVVINPADSSMITYGITNEDGQFFLPSVPFHEAMLQITYIGYGSFESLIKPPSQGNVLALGDVVLSRDNVLLKEVVVKAAHVPVSIHGDTILYNADAFKIGSNDAVEDLLKKLPGIEVSPGGEIKAQGENVGKVLVDGKEFFGNDPRMATKNLPANIVDKVAVFDKKSDEAQFSGINDGNEVKTIDLKLREDKKNGVFGKLSAAYGTNDRFMGKAQVNKFSPSMQLSLIGNANNVNEIGFRNDISELSTGGGIVIVQGGPNQNNTSSGVNRALSSGVNFNYDFSKSLRLRSSYLYKNLFNDLQETVNSTYLNPERAIQSSEVSSSRLKDQGHNANLTLEFDRDTTWQGRLTSRLNLGQSNDGVMSLTNNSVEGLGLLSSSDRNNQVSDGQLNFTNDFSLRKRMKKPGRIWSVSGTGNVNHSNAEEEIWASLTNGNMANLLNQFQDRNLQTGELSLTGRFSTPMNKSTVLHTSLGLGSENQAFNKNFYDINSGGNVLIDNLGGEANKSFENTRIGFALQKVLSEELTLQVGITGQSSRLSFDQLSGNIGSNTQTYLHLLPSFSLNKNSRNGSYNLLYRSQVNQPGIQQMATILENSNPLFLFLGNANLKPEYNHRLNAYYHKYDAFYFRNHMAFANFSYVNSPIVNARNSDENFVTTFRPVNGRFSFTGTGNYSYSAPSLVPFLKYSTTAGISYTSETAYVNDLESINQRISPSLSLGLENKSKNHFDVSINYLAEYTNSSYSSELIENVSYLNQRWRLHLEWYINKDLTFGGDYLHKIYSVEAISTDNTLRFMNLFVNWDLGKKKRWTLELKANDVLNQNSGIERSASPLMISERSYSGLGRYMLLSVQYSLSDFKPKGTFIMR